MNFGKLEVGDLFEWQGWTYRRITEVKFRGPRGEKHRFNAVTAWAHGSTTYNVRYFQPSASVRKIYR